MSFGAKCDGGRKLRLLARNAMVGGNDVFRSFVHERGAFLRFFPSSNKLNGFHIYNTLAKYPALPGRERKYSCRIMLLDKP